MGAGASQARINAYIRRKKAKGETNIRVLRASNAEVAILSDQDMQHIHGKTWAEWDKAARAEGRDIRLDARQGAKESFKATDVSQAIDAFIDEHIVPVEVSVRRVNGGDWIVTDLLSESTVDSFVDFDSLKKCLLLLGAFAVPQDVLNQENVNYPIPVEKIRLDAYETSNEDGLGPL